MIKSAFYHIYAQLFPRLGLPYNASSLIPDHRQEITNMQYIGMNINITNL